MRKIKYSKGFSLTELIAVIVIITLLVTIGTTTFIGVRKSILTTEYNNLVVYLETKASEYASETNVTRISVDDLIKEGYVKPDDDNYIYNPINKEKMNCYIINSYYDSNENAFISTLDKNLQTDDGKCKEYTKTSNLEICRVNDDEVCTKFSDNDWFSNNIT